MGLPGIRGRELQPVSSAVDLRNDDTIASGGSGILGHKGSGEAPFRRRVDGGPVSSGG